MSLATLASPAVPTDDQIFVVSGDDAVLVALRGQITATLRDQASQALSDVARTDRAVVLDLSDVTGIDQSGLAFIWQLAAVEREHNAPIVIRNAPPSLLHTMDSLHMLADFEIAATSPVSR